MKKDTVIKVENVSKKFCKSLKRSMVYGITDITKNAIGLKSNSQKLRKDEFWAVDDVSFEVKRGETLGIIGPNGSGKTTLLKMLNGIFWPDKGKITIKGRVGALIAVGAGFHPLMTGRENIYINASILGMSKREIDKKFDEIVEFADIGDFIDSPVKTYSSGMYVRLGFAIAVHCEPEILLVDEILSVGDFKFRQKSESKFNELLKTGTSVVFVSHSFTVVKEICNKAILLNKGGIAYYGDSTKSIEHYHLLLNRKDSQELSYSKINKLEKSTGEIDILSCKVYQYNANKESNEIITSKNFIIELEYKCNKSIKDVDFRINIIARFNNSRIVRISYNKKNLNKNQKAKLKFTIENNNLHHGVYIINLSITKKHGYSHLLILPNYTNFIIKNPNDTIKKIDYIPSIINFKYSVEEIKNKI